ncbi:hypothetical protein BH747_09970 [Enterococcus villorum]|uniref:Uncharacterized protein n=1 Tax=Enterococcus villorum TaxID=112904 RepID=A0A1V8YAD4_9ENTE|nr:hypothetical protein [Enterococcus villorum]OQO69587.1 hypothetical protein BH747_09970 [Enterococcus villorum]OQO72661.1 hypothetical protein BH744_11130 [Enterococcus villorum]
MKDDQNNQLLGASIQLKDIKVLDSAHDNVLVSARTITLSKAQQSIAQMVNLDRSKNKGITQLQIGDSS